MIDVNSTISFKEDLNTKAVVTYNGNPYAFELTMTDFPTFNYSMEWKGKYNLNTTWYFFKQIYFQFYYLYIFFLLDDNGNTDQLMIDGYLIMDDKAKVHATYIRNNGREVMPMGSITKYLNEENWWGTKNEMNTDEWNSVWVLKYLSKNNFEQDTAVPH